MADSDQVQQPPSYGYRSYAELIKRRLIYGEFYSGWSKRQGRYVYRVMSGPVPDDRYWRREPIGYEMTLADRIGRASDDDWVLRVYMDGTALYRPYKLGWLRHPTLRTIQAVLDYFFYKETEVAQGSYYDKMHVLRRKPINPHYLSPVVNGFGEFLTSKYNK